MLYTKGIDSVTTSLPQDLSNYFNRTTGPNSAFSYLVIQGRPEKLRGPGQRVKVGSQGQGGFHSESQLHPSCRLLLLLLFTEQSALLVCSGIT